MGPARPWEEIVGEPDKPSASHESNDQPKDGRDTRSSNSGQPASSKTYAWPGKA